MQAMGLVNDHLDGCDVRAEIERAPRPFRASSLSWGQAAKFSESLSWGQPSASSQVAPSGRSCFKKCVVCGDAIAAEISLEPVPAPGEFARIFERWRRALGLYQPGHGQKTSDRILRRDLSRHGARQPKAANLRRRRRSKAVPDDSRVALEKFGAECFAYCLMGNHFHLVIHTPRANIADVMQHIDGLYTQYCELASPYHRTSCWMAAIRESSSTTPLPSKRDRVRIAQSCRSRTRQRCRRLAVEQL